MTIIDDSERQDGHGDLWHGMVWLVDPNTKIRLTLVWHEVYDDQDEAQEAVGEHMRTDCPPNWSQGSIAYAPSCPACGTN